MAAAAAAASSGSETSTVATCRKVISFAVREKMIVRIYKHKVIKMPRV